MINAFGKNPSLNPPAGIVAHWIEHQPTSRKTGNSWVSILLGFFSSTYFLSVLMWIVHYQVPLWVASLFSEGNCWANQLNSLLCQGVRQTKKALIGWNSLNSSLWEKNWHLLFPFSSCCLWFCAWNYKWIAKFKTSSFSNTSLQIIDPIPRWFRLSCVSVCLIITLVGCVG